MKRSRLSKCAVFLLSLCLLLSPVFMARAEADDAPPSDDIITDTPSGGGDSPDVPSGGGENQDTPSGGGENQDTPSGGGDSPDVPSGGGDSPDVPSGGGENQDTPSGGGENQDTPSGGGENQDTPSGGGDSPDTPSGGIDSPDNPSGGEDSEPSQPNAVVTNAANDTFPGTWQQDANGVWHYVASNAFRNTWGYIVNPYAKESYVLWYQLDSEGKTKVTTGDRFWYDATGNMLTGWQYINGKWYYSNPDKDGTLGVLQLGVTPDGWTLDKSGA